MFRDEIVVKKDRLDLITMLLTVCKYRESKLLAFRALIIGKKVFFNLYVMSRSNVVRN